MDFCKGSETVVFVELVRQLVQRCTPWNMHILFGIIYTAGELPLAQLGHFFLAEAYLERGFASGFIIRCIRWSTAVLLQSGMIGVDYSARWLFTDSANRQCE